MKKFSHYLYQIIIPTKDDQPSFMFNYPCYNDRDMHFLAYYISKGATVRLIDVVYDEVENGKEN